MSRKASVPQMLMRANEALQAGLAGLKHLDDLNCAFGEMLKAAVHVAGAQTGWIVFLDADGGAYRFVAVMTREGRLLRTGDLLLRAIPVKGELSLWVTGMFRGPGGWPLSPQAPLHSPEMRSFHEAQGNRALRHVPMHAADRLIGWLGFGFSDAHASFGRARPILEVLADQMTMLAEVSRLAALAKQPAINREQENVAQERAAELTRGDEVIRNSLSELRDCEPDNFVRFALLELAKQTRAETAQFFGFSPGSNQLRQLCAVRNGEVLGKGHPSDPLEFQSGFDAGEASPYQNFRENSGIVWSSIGSPDPHMWPFMATWHRKMNHGSYAGVALSACSRPLGLLGLAFARQVTLTEAQNRLVVAMSLQISLALEIGEAAQQRSRTAAAQEREKAERERALELSKANAALRRSADRLANHPHPTAKTYLDAVLLEASAATGARCALIHQIDSTGQWLSLTACTIDNQIVDIAIDPRVSVFRPPVTVGQVRGWALSKPGESRWVDIEAESSQLWQFAIPWHREMGHKTLAMFPLLIGESHIGIFALCFTTRERPTEPKLELCSTLSQHAALAIELNRLSDEARESAVHAEQEKAARDRAAELSSANDAMQRSTERLSTLNNLGEFVVEVLKTIEEVTGAVGSTVFLYDEATKTAYAKTMVLEGLPRDFLNDPDLLSFRNPVALHGKELQTWERIFSSSGYHWSDVDDETHASEARAWHRARGHATIVHFPLRRSTRRIGLLALSFREKFPPVPARLDMVGVLGQQLILAIETSRLSEEAQKAATLEERNRIAREIHDTLAQSFTGVLIQLQAVDGSLLGKNHEQMAIHLQNATLIAQKGLAEARRSVKALRPSELESGSLSEALKLVAELAQQQSGVSVVVEYDVCTHVQPAYAAEILRIVQEAIMNAVKHARATLITVSCHLESDNQLLCIADDGVGFKLEKQTEGFGLVGMRERAAKIGGELRVNTSSRGTSICVSVPLRQEIHE